MDPPRSTTHTNSRGAWGFHHQKLLSLLESFGGEVALPRALTSRARASELMHPWMKLLKFLEGLEPLRDDVGLCAPLARGWRFGNLNEFKFFPNFAHKVLEELALKDLDE